MTAPSPLDRLLAIEQLRDLQARLCRLASARDWPAVEELFLPDGRFRAFGADGALTCFADGPGIGQAIDRALGAGTLIVRAFGEEFDVLSDSRAEARSSVEDLLFVGDRERVLHGFGWLSVAYRRDGGHWRIRSAEFTRIAREQR
ncbi:nuclear transport factor 2 family protein [Microbacterium kyungheense]|uniref:SnoaL-like protein n=1 Tax=Microbacterium kyungheense TaxID=1263636 RepID=A0A543EFD5_9MICO|nr:nuclear transport factor 2 family protein [Microbacterium kyungheense]TQM20291.1 SnoaL-like protein [Microbacterium kyungheense]